MEDEFASFNADHAVNINAEQFTKYRAIEVLNPDRGLNLQSALPQKLSKPCNDERQFVVSLPDKSEKSVPVSTIPISSIRPTVPCPDKPFHICPKESLCIVGLTFALIQAIVERVLRGLSDYDWSFLPTENSWKCKYFQGSNVREVSIKCFWDATADKHVVEVKRVKGDGILSNQCSTVDILEQLRTAFGAQETSQPVVKKGGKLRGALPLPSALKTVPNKEQFLQGVNPILKMAGSPNFESRVEASRMLCDLAEKSDKSLLQLPECQDICFQILDLLLHDNEDQSEEVKQFALMAFGLLAEHDCYQECFLHFKDFDEIIRMIDNAPTSTNRSSCECIQMRRQAAKGMAKLVKKATNAASPPSAKLTLLKQFQSYGHLDEQNWRQHCNSLKDERLKSFALEILPCFQ